MPPAATRLEAFISSRGIKPAHLARESIERNAEESLWVALAGVSTQTAIVVPLS